MNKKLMIFLTYQFFSSFLLTMLFVYPLAFYLKNMGAPTLPYAMIAASMIIPLSSYLIKNFAKKSGALENSIIFYYIAIIFLLLIFIFIKFMGYIATSAVLLFVVSYASVTLIYMTSWMLLEKSFNVFDFKRYCSTFLAAEEFGASVSCVIMLFLIHMFHIDFFVYLSMLIATIIMLFLLFIKNERSDFVKMSEELSLKSETLNIQRKTFKEKIILILLFFTIMLILFEASIYYEVGFVLEKTFGNEVIINEILYKIRLISNVLAFSFNAFASSYIIRKFNIGNSFIMYGCIMSFVFVSMYFFPEWYIFSIAAIIRYLAQYSFYTLGVEQTLNSLVSYKRIQTKSFLDAIIVPGATILSSGFLILFATVGSFSILNIILLICGLSVIILSTYYQKIYELYHRRFIHSKDKQECLQSIHALGSSTPESIRESTVQKLTKIMERTTSNHIRSNVIKVLGEIKKPALEKVLFKQMKRENELVQTETVLALGKYNTFTSQDFLVNSILFGHVRLSSWHTRLALYRALYKILGKGIAPLLLPSLHSRNARTVAHTIDALSIVSDQRLIDIIMPFLNHKNARVRGSAIIFLYAYEKCRSLCLEHVETMYQSPDEYAVDTAIFVIGTLKLKQYEERLLKSLDDAVYTDAHYIKLAFALSCFENERGYALFSDFFLCIRTTDYTSQYIERILLHYNQVDKNIRFRIIEQYIGKGGDPLQLMNFFSTSTLDFMDEIQMLKDIGRML